MLISRITTTISARRVRQSLTGGVAAELAVLVAPAGLVSNDMHYSWQPNGRS